MGENAARRAGRKRLGAWYTPHHLVDDVVAAVITDTFVGRSQGRPIRVLDPACGDGRFLAAVRRRVEHLGGSVSLTGADIDTAAVESSRAALPAADIVEADALRAAWPAGSFDLVIGNPPFLSQLAAATSRGGAGSRGGGPYADAAVQFLALGAELVDPTGGRLAMVLPQSVLSSRDAASIRSRIDAQAVMCWSWWTGERVFDAQVLTCAVAFEFGRSGGRSGDWSSVITGPGGIPALPQDAALDGVLGERARLNANFRDEYYGLVPAVGDDVNGPRLVTSGLIDPGTTMWGRRPITFARRRIARPRVDLALLDDRMGRWAHRRLVPKVLVANQTSIIEAVCDPRGEWLPGVPVVGVYPTGAHWDEPSAPEASSAVDRQAPLAERAWEIAAVLTSPFASAWLWHRSAGTGLSATAVRSSPTVLADLPWPRGDLTSAVAALRVGDVHACGRAAQQAYGLEGRSDLWRWWTERLQRIEARQPAID